MTQSEKLLLAMQQDGGKLSVKALTSMMGLAEKRIHEILARLRIKGYIKADEYRSGRGSPKQYWLTAKGKVAEVKIAMCEEAPDDGQPAGPNVPIVEAAMIKIKDQAGNPFAWLMTR